MQWMIYGANGYTGELIAREAQRRGLVPLLAGRSRSKLETLARDLGLSLRCFDLADADAVTQGLSGIGLVLHCAGPFSQTSAPMIEGCLRVGAHYLDITGEIAVFEHAHAPAQHVRAVAAGVVLCPGVGFDVIPTDCIALALKQALPDAVELTLGFEQPAVLSPGTAKTTVEFIGGGCRVRRAGRIVGKPLGHAPRRIDFGTGVKSAMAISWGDVSTAFHTTGIPNISVYIPASGSAIFGARAANLIRPLLRLGPVKRWLQALIGRRVKGPDEAARSRTGVYVWGEAINAAGVKRTARIKTVNGYSLTVTGALEVTQYLLGTKVAGGAITPSRLLGSDLVTRLPGSGPMVVT